MGSSYPYTDTDGSCKSSCTTSIPKCGITGYKSVGNFLFGASVDDLKSALQSNPVSIAIEADQSAFQNYKSGVLSSGCGTQLDHGVLAAGYALRTVRSTGSSRTLGEPPGATTDTSRSPPPAT